MKRSSPALALIMKRKKENPLLQFIFGVFIMLHGLVHLLYLGQSARRFELRPGMVWPDGAWAFSTWLGDKITRSLANILCALAACGFIAGGAGILMSQAWWRSAVVGSAVLSSIIFMLLWNGKLQKVDDQGGVGVLIDLAILTAVLVLQGPSLGF